MVVVVGEFLSMVIDKKYVVVMVIDNWYFHINLTNVSTEKGCCEFNQDGFSFSVVYEIWCILHE